MSTRISRPQRLASWAVAVIAAIHIVLTMVWVAPSNSIVKEIIPRKTLAVYMEPMFSQSWSVFAPNPMSGTYHLEVRAALAGAGAPEITEWVDATAAEYTFKYHQLAPGRASKTADILAQRFKDAHDALVSEQKPFVENNYFKDDWQERFKKRLVDNQSSKAKTSTYLRLDRMVTAYATQVAHAVWDGEIERVQFRVTRTAPISFAKRHNPDAKPPKPTVINAGWRGTVVEEGQNSERFAEFFLRGLEGAKKRG